MLYFEYGYNINPTFTRGAKTMKTLTEIKRKNKEIGHHFFDKETLNFFNSKIKNKTYKDKYFLTSEQFDYKSPRLYTIRIFENDGNIDTFGDFQQFETVKQCEDFIEENG